MSSQNQVTPRDLLEEAKKRVLFLVICIVGLSYMMSLTSSSVWVNLPAAAFLIILIRYFSLDLEMRRKAASYIRRPLPEHGISQEKPLEFPKVVKKSEWRRKVNSRVAEDAIDHFSRHLISEWVTDLWYSRLTPDKEGPEELINIVNGVLGEIAGRFRNINLIDLLMRDLINLICTHLENFRSTKLKIEKRQLGTITLEKLDTELRQHLAMENRLHPALFSSEAQHKVLQHVMDGLILYTFKHENLQCLYFRYTARELLASAVMRPVLNLASPRFINERIESLVINMKKPKTVESMHENLGSKTDGSPSIPSDDLSKFLDPSMAGVELVQMKNAQSTTPTNLPTKFNCNASFSKDPLLSIDTRSSRSWNSEPPTSQNVHENTVQKHNSGEWGEKLDQFSRRKDKALAPEHFENMWAKGRNYKMKENENQSNKNTQHGLPQGKPLSISVKREKRISKTIDIENEGELNCSKNKTVHLGCTDPLTVNGSSCRTDSDILNNSTVMHYQDNDRDVMHLNDLDSDGNTSEDEETSNVTGLDSPVTKVWNARNNRNAGISHIHHPLESSDGCRVKKAVKGKDHNNRLSRNQSGRKRSRHNSEKLPVWQEVERTSFISGDGQDILNSPLGPANDDDSSDDSDMESSGRIHSGAAASSSVLSISHILPTDYSQSSHFFMHNPPSFLIFFLLFASTFCHGSDLTTVEVVGVGECADCYKNNIKTNHAFSGLSVSIDCKQKDGTTERKGVAKLDEEGNFKVLLPTEVLNKDGNLKGKCFAQLHSASSTPCPSHDGSEMASMIAIKSKDKGKQTFGLPNGIKFKSETCVSAFFWHHYFHHPPLPPFSIPVFPPHPPVYTHPLFPPKVYVPPTTPVYEKPPPVEEKPPPVEEKPPPVEEKPPPVYVEPLPPPVPVYKPKPPVYKPKPPVYKPKPPVYKPEPPVYKPKPPVYKPKPPVYKPKPPVYKPKPPVYKPKPPVYKPPTPQKPESPPYYKHPWYKILPPISKLPPCPPTPKVVVPPKYYSHPKIGKKFPPLSPSVPHLN